MVQRVLWWCVLQSRSPGSRRGMLSSYTGHVATPPTQQLFCARNIVAMLHPPAIIEARLRPSQGGLAPVRVDHGRVAQVKSPSPHEMASRYSNRLLGATLMSPMRPRESCTARGIENHECMLHDEVDLPNQVNTLWSDHIPCKWSSTPLVGLLDLQEPILE